MYNQHTRGITTTRHRSLVERDRRKAFVQLRDKSPAHTKKKGEKNVRKNRIFTNLKKRIQIESST